MIEYNVWFMFLTVQRYSEKKFKVTISKLRMNIRQFKISSNAKDDGGTSWVYVKCCVSGQVESSQVR